VKIRLTLRARADLAEAVAFVSTEHPAYARRLRHAFLHTIRLISQRPHLGIRNERARDLRSRLVLRFPYRVHYLVRPDEVIIVHIRHTARRPWDTPTDIL
jgi:plasmid stabilization system protein ParE